MLVILYEAIDLGKILLIIGSPANNGYYVL